MSAAREPDGPGEVLTQPLAALLPTRKDARLIELMGKKLGLHTVGDVLAYPPRRLEDRGALTGIDKLVDGEQVTIIAQIQTVSTRPMKARRGRITEARIGDGNSTLTVTLFNAPQLARQLVTGRHGLFSGKISRYRSKQQLLFPAFTLLDDPEAIDNTGVLGTEAMTGNGSGGRGIAALLTRPLIPIYPATKDVHSWQIAYVADRALHAATAAGLRDPLPEVDRAERSMLDLLTALRQMHQPLTRAEWASARTRLAFDEALSVQLVLARRRHSARAVAAIPRPALGGGLVDRLDARLPFDLTAGQREVGAVIAEELAGRAPMQRLLQGEVGSGKTVVALRAMLQVVDSGAQAVLLAPTEVLATQHARTLAALLGPLGEAGRLGAADGATRVALLTGSLGAKARRAALLDAAGGAAGIVIGTHALLEERVQFADLGLVVVDEQHRFGVEQRDALRSRADAPPHVLVMTATPIPRTVAMTVFGDLETSVLRERPAGRAAVSTTVVPIGERPRWLDRAWTRVVEEVRAGRQAFVVCPRIGDDGPGDDDGSAEDAPPPDESAQAGLPDDSAASDSGASDSAASDPVGSDPAAGPPSPRPARAVLEVFDLLREGALADVRVGLLHGRLPAEEKDVVMTRFAAGELDVLVATTVIEVGVDVPNATAMVVLDADRFGISQLHQLRGRIGRGEHPGVCLLVTEARAGSAARERLDAVAASNDGFELAEADLRQRREGDVLGAAQSGVRRSLRLVSLLTDRDLIADARHLATRLVDSDPELRHHPGLRSRVVELEAGDRAQFLEKS